MGLADDGPEQRHRSRTTFALQFGPPICTRANSERRSAWVPPGVANCPIPRNGLQLHPSTEAFGRQYVNGSPSAPEPVALARSADLTLEAKVEQHLGDPGMWRLTGGVGMRERVGHHLTVAADPLQHPTGLTPLVVGFAEERLSSVGTGAVGERDYLVSPRSPARGEVDPKTPIIVIRWR